MPPHKQIGDSREHPRSRFAIKFRQVAASLIAVATTGMSLDPGCSSRPDIYRFAQPCLAGVAFAIRVRHCALLWSIITLRSVNWVPQTSGSRALPLGAWRHTVFGTVGRQARRMRDSTQHAAPSPTPHHRAACGPRPARPRTSPVSNADCGSRPVSASAPDSRNKTWTRL